MFDDITAYIEFIYDCQCLKLTQDIRMVHALPARTAEVTFNPPSPPIFPRSPSIHKGDIDLVRRSPRVFAYNFVICAYFRTKFSQRVCETIVIR